MEELVQDLVSALEQTSEQAKLDELWEEMVLSPLQHRRQVRRRRGRKRRCDFSLHGPEHSRCLSEASESSLDEAFARNQRQGATAAVAIATAAVVPANYSDSDDTVIAKRWPSASVSFRARQHSWPESDSFTENTPGRPLRRRRKVKRMTSDVTVSLQQKLRVSGLERREQTHHHYHHHHHHQRSYKKQRLGRLKKRPGAWPGQDGGSVVAGVGGLSADCWKDKILRQAKEQREASDENMSECETSSVCSSDPGLFTNDEGRQGDDEQSDWFFEGECVSGMSVQGLRSSRESETAPRPAGLDARREKSHSATFLQPARPNQRGYHARLNRLPDVAARCIRRGRRRLPGRDNNMAVFVDKMRSYPHDSYRKEFWLPSFGKRDRSQLKPLCPLPMYPIGMVPESSLPRCSSPMCKSSRQPNVQMGLLCAGDIKRRRKTTAVPTTASAYLPFRKEAKREEVDQGLTKAPSTRGDCAVPLPSTSRTHCFIKPGTSFSSHGEHEDD
ncbi:G patch domain-containing protein 2-like [Colossoma macropomum]|uniref:G patch domain-containing protein 2-like n=1 Tax=Colossoma macropomum TaxID=42526 RepID=UPI0018643584|nr:G patch domain-containing protein 2-like [Colossoma macropomum]